MEREERIQDEGENENGGQSSQQRQPVHTRFQNTLATSAGLTAVISKSGSLYTFGLNHRGQCGIGTFSPNVWAPTQVAGLASLRFVLDHGTIVNDGNSEG